MTERDREPQGLRQPNDTSRQQQQTTYEHPPLTRDQEQYLRRIQSSSNAHDRNLLMGGPRNKPAS
ncbi:hypothetical protein XH99_14035 [Bradyrhizobium nanningense]|uniref:Uncharacterized protein n=1 Tax=Bradyrhizobium nanningense TaxID=1325118 RepID=A0A4Q0S626_9BRAD|nr:hypothetical protein [Bradyrhizobium nanningense]RXH28928.1 hypothetical protein XH99_14035 [Bradyrhizobium nanningense]